MARLFLALSLPDSWRQALERRCHGLPGARWIRDRQFHLTLRFLGETDAEQEAQLLVEAGRVRSSPFELRAAGFGIFPPRGRPRVLWAGVHAEPALLALQAEVEKAVRRAGFPPEGRAFHPHITLGRLQNARPAEVRRWLAGQLPLDLPPAAVTSFDLYSSQLRPEGARHRLERSFPLF